jgi:8-oxo-dGTP pyrophosphatase MutT (NUDIX family)
MNTITNNIQHKRKIYCCNCGKLGHVLKNCLEPIISLGIILYNKDNNTGDIKFLMIRRKFSLGFMDFIMGKYNIHNLDYLHRIFNEMTIEEKVKILNLTFEKLWFTIDYNCVDFSSPTLSDELRRKIDSDYNASKRKFYLIKHGFINKNNEYVNLNQIIRNSRHNWLEQEWEFPKGKRKMNESNLDAAIREFSEETEYSTDYIDIILTDYPLIEKYYGSNNKKYKHIYYIAKANKFVDYDNYVMTENQDIEISCIKWMTYEEAMLSIRPYQIEKKMILNKVIDMLI